MKYPSLDAFIQQNMSENPTVEDIFELAAGCIDQVYDEKRFMTLSPTKKH